MPYTISLITPEEKEQLAKRCAPGVRYEIKSEIFGCCIKLLSDDRALLETWQENFSPMSQNIRSHGRLYVFKDPSCGENTVQFDPYSKTAFLFNFSYYGWIKSIALGLCGDILEDEHGISSVHGACVDVAGKGLAMVGTSGAGKTTQTYGLLRDPHARIISDDWFFARVFGPEILAYGSERNFYIRQDLSAIWKEFGGLVNADEYDADGRAVADIRWAVGKGRLLPLSTLNTIIILKRDAADPQILTPLENDEALRLFTENGYFNPHLLVKNPRKDALRNRYIVELIERTDCYLLNTTGTPKETQNVIRAILKMPETG
ncbi:aldolase [Methanoregula sp.]|uniref:aldolase n=1 Tax=Methanoregula sp. TaxID=2052170 RepID=UPI003563D6B2